MGSVEADDDWRIADAVDWQILRRLVLETSMDHQSKLVQDPLRDVQPVHGIVKIKR